MTKDESAMLVECHAMLTKITKQIDENDAKIAKNETVKPASTAHLDDKTLGPGEGTYDAEIDGRWI